MEPNFKLRISKKDIIERVASKANCEIKDAMKFTDAFVNVLLDILLNADPGTKVVLREFGTFRVHQTKPRKSAHNPKSPNVKIQVPARRRISFRPSKMLKDALKEALSSEGAPKQQQVIL